MFQRSRFESINENHFEPHIRCRPQELSRIRTDESDSITVGMEIAFCIQKVISVDFYREQVARYRMRNRLEEVDAGIPVRRTELQYVRIAMIPQEME